MATTMIPPTAPVTPSTGVRFVPVRASLMPEEVLSSRQLVVVRKRVLAALIVVAVLLIGSYGLSWWQTRSANNDLATAQHQGMQLQSQQTQFGPLVQAQAQITSIQTQLQSLMSRDLQWKALLVAVRATEPNGVGLSAITGSLNGATTSGLTALPGSAAGVGTLTLTGTAPDKRTVAAYADQLAKVKGLTAPLISSVQASTRPVTFTISAALTSDAFGGRYTPATSVPATSTTGGH
jgi:Tfp pilus assembly protein PilN